jgi:hypothetical protein
MMKYLLLLALFIFCKTNSNAQYYRTQQQDTLRWFVGKWVDRNTFKIDSTINGKGGGGGTITRNANGTLDISTPENKDFEKRISDGIAAIEDEKKEITNIIKEEEGIYQFNLADKSKQELEKVEAELKGFAEQKKEFVPPPPDPLSANLQEVANVAASNCRAFEAEYHRIIDFYKAHRRDNHPHFDLPAPPVADYFNCWGCDSTKRIEFDTLSNRYVRDFYKDIRNDIKFLLSKLQQMEAMGIGNGNNGDNEMERMMNDLFSPNAHHPGACSYMSMFDMSAAVDFYLNRGMQMADQLWKDNKKNYGALAPVIQICLAAYQQHAYLSGSSNDDYQMRQFAGPLEDLHDTMTMLLCKKRDYRLMGSIPFMINLERTILNFTGGSDGANGEIFFGDKYHPKYDYKTLIGFPHFKLTVELDVKTGANGSYVISHLKGSSKVNAELDDKECVKFTLAKKEEGKIKTTLITNEAISPSPHGIYVGTKTYTSQSPIFKIRFCEIEGQPQGDSLYLSTFVPLSPDKGNWNVQGRMAPTGINQADRLFINVNELKNDVQNIKPEFDQKQLEDIQKNALEMAGKIKAMQAAGNVDPAKMGAMVKQLMNNSNSVVETQTSELMRIRLPLKVTNMDPVLINQRFDAKEINPSMANAIVYAYLTIKLQHDPGNGSEEE